MQEKQNETKNENQEKNNEVNSPVLGKKYEHIKDIKGSKDGKEKTYIELVKDEDGKLFVHRVCKNRNMSDTYESLMDVKHPNAVVIYDFKYENENTYVREEYIDGTTLKNVIDDYGVFSEEKTILIATKVCDALEQFHKHNPPIIHNDINPSNIMLRDDESIKVIDFDISRTFKEDASQNTKMYATKDFASSEHYNGQTTPQSDIYSLGATMHYMLTEKTAGFQDIQKSIDSAKYSRGFKKVIKKCTNLYENERYKSIAELRNDLEKIPKSNKKIRLIFIIIPILVAILAVALFFLPNIFSGDNTTQTTTISSDNTTTSTTDTQGSDSTTTDNSQGESNNTTTTTQQQGTSTVKKMEIVAKLDNGMIDSVVLNDGTFVYLEKASNGYHLKNLTGIDNNIGDKKYTTLMHNPYTDELYAIETTYSKMNIYQIDTSLKINPEPIYSANGLNENVSYGFFSDGALFCDAFYDSLIDSTTWITLGKIYYYYDSSRVAVVVSDTLYCINSDNLSSISFNDETIEKFQYPGHAYYSPLTYVTDTNIYILMTVQNKDYIYSFDGNNFTQIICLNDYNYYTNTAFSQMCVTDNAVYLYHSDTQTIRQFKF